MLNLSVYVSARFIAPWFEVVYAHSQSSFVDCMAEFGYLLKSTCDSTITAPSAFMFMCGCKQSSKNLSCPMYIPWLMLSKAALCSHPSTNSGLYVVCLVPTCLNFCTFCGWSHRLQWSSNIMQKCCLVSVSAGRLGCAYGENKLCQISFAEVCWTLEC